MMSHVMVAQGVVQELWSAQIQDRKGDNNKVTCTFLFLVLTDQMSYIFCLFECG